MRISPVTRQNTYNTYNTKPSFKGYDQTAKYAEFLLEHNDMLTREHFLSGMIHKGLAQLNYYDPMNVKALKKLYRYAISTLRIESYDRRPDIAIREGLENNNTEYLNLLIDKMGVIPFDPQGNVPTDIILAGKRHYDPRIRSLFDDEYLLRKTAVLGWGAWDEGRLPYEIIEGKDLFDETIWMNRLNAIMQIDKSPKKTLPPENVNRLTFVDVKNIINKDEEEFGTVTLASIHKIVTNPSFISIKHEPLNISGNKILHILSEVYINPNNRNEVQMLEDIIQMCKRVHYNFNIKNDFGETALDLAKQAESTALINILERDYA